MHNEIRGYKIGLQINGNVVGTTVLLRGEKTTLAEKLEIVDLGRLPSTDRDGLVHGRANGLRITNGDEYKEIVRVSPRRGTGVLTVSPNKKILVTADPPRDIGRKKPIVI